MSRAPPPRDAVVAGPSRAPQRRDVSSSLSPPRSNLSTSRAPDSHNSITRSPSPNAASDEKARTKAQLKDAEATFHAARDKFNAATLEAQRVWRETGYNAWYRIAKGEADRCLADLRTAETVYHQAQNSYAEAKAKAQETVVVDTSARREQRMEFQTTFQRVHEWQERQNAVEAKEAEKRARRVREDGPPPPEQ